MRILVSTKTSSVMKLLPPCPTLVRPPPYRQLAAEIAPHCVLVFTRLAHTLSQELAHESGKAHLSLRCVYPRPLGGFLVEGDGDVLHRVRRQNTRSQCILTQGGRKAKHGSG